MASSASFDQRLASSQAAAEGAARSATKRRIVSALVASGGAVVLALAAWISPGKASLGTHTQLGLPPCGFEVTTGLPCATCGMTTAFAYAAEGRLWTSFVTQPAGFLLAVATALSVIIGVYVAVTGADVRPLARLWSPRMLFLLGGIVLGAWAYKLVVTIGAL